MSPSSTTPGPDDIPAEIADPRTPETGAAPESRFLHLLGWVATCTAVGMYVAYIPQIHGNLTGNKGSWLQPLVAAINCTLWVGYGLLKRPRRDWPIVFANLPGILFGLAAFATAL